MYTTRWVILKIWRKKTDLVVDISEVGAHFLLFAMARIIFNQRKYASDWVANKHWFSHRDEMNFLWFGWMHPFL